jgi:hypothetical protein
MGSLEVTYGDIERLDALQLTRLLKKLLHLEADAHGIPRSCADVSLKITVSDGGEDGRIQWSGGSEWTERIPRRFTVFQCKATDMGPEDFRKEILQERSLTLKRAVAEVLEEGGGYVVFLGRSCNAEERGPRLSKMRETLREVGRSDADVACLDIYDAGRIADWTNRFTQAVVYVWESTGRSLPLGLQTWGTWRPYGENRWEYVPNTTLSEYIREIRAQAAQPRAVIRIVGLPGLGKTRLAFEAFRPPETQDNVEQQALSDRVLYYDAAFSYAHLLDFIRDVSNRDLTAVLVVDNCSLEVHNALAREVARTDSQMSLVTLDAEPEGFNKGEPVVVLKPDMLGDIVKSLIARAYPDLSEMDVDRIARVAQGFPKMAVLFAEARLRGDKHIGLLTDRQLIERLVWGREDKDEDAWRVLRSCSIFEYIGIEGRVCRHSEFVAEKVCSLSREKFYETYRRFLGREIIQRRGDFIRVIPQPLALALAADWWRSTPPKKAYEVIESVFSIGMDKPFFDQMKMLDSVEEVRDMVGKLCDPTGPFSNPEALNSERGSRAFGSLVEVHPQVTVAVLDRVFGSWTREQLLEVKAGRRNLIWALENLCFWSDTFPTAARLMLGFAAAENETWGNNATGQFLQLFQVLLSGTQAPPWDRLPIVREALESEVPEKRQLAVRALSRALQTGHFTRSGGVETQGSRAPQTDWYPRTPSDDDDILKYWDDCLEILADVACAGNDLSDLAVQELTQNIRGLIAQGRLDKLESAIQRIARIRGMYWPAALQGIKDAIAFASSRLPAEDMERLKKWVEWLSPSDLPSRLRLTVSTPTHERERDSEGHFTDTAGERVESLAEELAAQGDSWYNLIPGLLEGDQYYGFPFGRRLGEITLTPRPFIDRSLECLTGLPPDRANPNVLIGFLEGLRDRALLSATLERILADERLGRFAVEATRCTKPEWADLDRLLNSVEAGKILVRDLQRFQYNSVLDHLPPNVVLDFCARIVHFGKEAARSALGILFMYCYDNKERWASCEDGLRGILLSYPLLEHTEGADQMFGHHWEETAKKLLATHPKDGELAAHLAEDIVGACTEEMFGMHAHHYVRPVMRLVLKQHLDESWPIVTKALLAQDWRIHHNLRYVLGRSYDRENDPCPVFEIPQEVLLNWCKQNGPRAAAAIADLMPLYIETEGGLSWRPIVKELIDDFGESDEVLRAISSNLFSFSAWGSMVPYYRHRVSLLNELRSHRIAKVRQWASKRIERLELEIKDESKQDEERDLGLL